MTVRILRAADRTAAPWKNGGGVTREIAARPEGAGTDTFAWRVSLAEVGADGPFSVFPEVARTLTVAEGAGMELTVGGERRRVAERFAPQDFAGDTETYGRLLDGPVVNFNVMYRRALTEALTSVVRGRTAVGVPPGATVLIVALDGAAVLEDAGVALGPGDAALVTGDAPGVLRADGHTALVTLRDRVPDA
ncbi:HutD family protein [Streptomyces sp. NBC_01387]|uniref:HutD/Ves family protein n=1 Tax=unclassified Streptomyces TaxID=2593676 RepID=UPI002024F3B0|nr:MULTISPECIES: HutD family protein [unclassified Streptomyces]MCX4551709.1 HutD family protein [Streptomyces sp. NBC_01500]WSC23083.1 HutD family protein [Streptomyces sp. NBC_01766]WSV56994.1 HutD family protein [Streptomyces sp. NBC_01014]